jgi:hypothetical protein
MHHTALLNTHRRVPFIASLACSCFLSLDACSTQHPAQQPSADSPRVIYAIPQAQAFAVAREALLSAAPPCGAEEVHIEGITRGGGIRGYQANYRSSFYRFLIVRRLYLIPTTGIAASGQQIDGFRFQITDDAYEYPHPLLYVRLPGGGCEKTLTGTLQAALDATGTATMAKGLRLRPYAEGNAGP